MVLFNPLLQFTGASVSNTEAAVLASIAQGKTLFHNQAEIGRLSNLDKKGFVSLHFFPNGDAKAEITGKATAWLQRHLPASLERHTPQGPIGRAVGPLHEEFLREQLEAHKKLKGLSAEELKQTKAVLPIQGKMSERAAQELRTLALLSGEHEGVEAYVQKTPWQKISAAALKRAALQGLPPSVARETLKGIAKEYQAIKNYEPTKHNPSLAISAITTRPENQPRHGLDQANVERIVQHYDAKRFAPLDVRKGVGGTYELIHGHHRFEAAKRLGMATVPVRVLQVNRKEAQRIAEEANLAGKSLTPSEMAKVIDRRLRAGESPQDIVAAMPGLGIRTNQVEDLARITKLPKVALEAVDDPVLSRHFTREHAVRLARAQEQYHMPPSEVQAFFNKVIMAQDISPQQMQKILDTFAPKLAQRKATQGSMFGAGFGGNFTGIMARIGNAAQSIKELESVDRRLGSIEHFIQGNRNVPKKLADSLPQIRKERQVVTREIGFLQRSLLGQVSNPEQAPNIAEFERNIREWETELKAFGYKPPRTLTVAEERAVNKGLLPIEMGQGRLLNPIDKDKTGAYYALLPRNYVLHGKPAWWIGPFSNAERADVTAGLARRDFAEVRTEKTKDGIFVGILGGYRWIGPPKVGPFDTGREAGAVLGKLKPHGWQPVLGEVKDIMPKDTRKLLPEKPAYEKAKAQVTRDEDSEAIQGLRSLGYRVTDAKEAVEAARLTLGASAGTEEIIRQVFKDAKAKNPVRLRDLVRTPKGEIATLSDLLAKKQAVITKIENWHGRYGKERAAYFVDMADGSGGWEIGKMAYESRMRESNPAAHAPCPACHRLIRIPSGALKVRCRHCNSALGVSA